MSSGKSVADTMTDLIAQIGENMSVRRTATLSVDPGVVSQPTCITPLATAWARSACWSR
jgi:hypothetical protein